MFDFVSHDKILHDSWSILAVLTKVSTPPFQRRRKPWGLADINKLLVCLCFPQDALTAMTGVAHHINEMKRQHEQAVHVQVRH